MAQNFENKHCRIQMNDPKPVVDLAKEQLRKRLDRAAERLKVKVQENVSIPTRTEGPSKPGEFPHADTGRLRQSIFWAAADGGDSRIVGTNVFYALLLEYEFDRSFLRRTLYEQEDQIRRDLEKPA